MTCVEVLKMIRFNRGNSQAGDAAKQIEKLTKEIKDRMLPGLEFKIEQGSIVFTRLSSYSDNIFDPTSLAELIASEMGEFDHPIQRKEGIDFCDFMGFEDKDRDSILGACCTDAQWNDWLDYWNRSESMYR